MNITSHPEIYKHLDTNEVYVAPPGLSGNLLDIIEVDNDLTNFTAKYNSILIEKKNIDPNFVIEKKIRKEEIDDDNCDDAFDELFGS